MILFNVKCINYVNKKYRTGAKRALLDIYEQAICDLKNMVQHIPDANLFTFIKTTSIDTNCELI